MYPSIFLILIAEMLCSASSVDTERLRLQYNELYSQFHGEQPPSSNLTKPNNSSLADDFTRAQDRMSQNSSSMKRSGSKSVRFTDSPSGTPTSEDANRAALMPYKDDEDDSPPDHSHLDNQQIHEYHSQVLREQDNQLDQLGESIGRTRHLSVQIGNELDDHVQMLEDVEGHVDRQQTKLDKARNRLGKIARKAKDNMQLTTIIILIIILVLLIIILN